MLAVFTKTLDLVTAADIAELPAQTWPEGYEVEFKETLPHRTGGVHPWLSGQGSIGDYARDEILAEVVAFANSQGGSVILGIAESSDNLPRAHAVMPLPRVGDLARRFEDQARSCIDPPLSRLQIRAIETDGQGGGVVVFRTSPSRAAPHRLTTNRESFVRRGSSTVKMTMREIQDMTLNVARGLAGLDATFKQRRDAFHEWAGNQMNAVAYRVTALPLVDLPDPGRIFGKQDVFAVHREFKATVGSRTFDLPMPIGNLSERPRLRGVARSGDHGSGAFLWELYQSGLTDLWISARPWNPLGRTGPTSFTLYHTEILGAVANSLSVLNHYREYIGVPDAEYGMEFEMFRHVQSYDQPILYYGLFADGGTDRYEPSELSFLLHRFPVGSHSEFENLISIIGIDLYDALCIRRPASSTPLQVNI
jgi:hypothetical protein